MALAFGLNDSVLGFGDNNPDARPILKEMGLMEK
jgi:hypothetical protein